MTLNQLNDLFKLYVTNSLQIKRYGFGEVYDISQLTSDAQDFPLMWVQLTNVNYPTENVKIANFNILFMDILKNDKSNEIEIWSDMVQAAEDMIKYLRYNSNTDYEVVGTPLITTFTERFTDYLGGATLNISIQLEFEQFICGIEQN